jgi:methyl-accepting chemotaxis protein
VCDDALHTISTHISSVYSNSSDEVKGCLDTLVNYGARLESLVREQKELLGIIEEAQTVESVAEPVVESVVADSVAVAAVVAVNQSTDGNTVSEKAKAPKSVARHNGGRMWYVENYEPAYNDFVTHVKRYIDLSHGELAPRAAQLSKNAYRSVTPILISLAVMISVVLMLYYFIYIYGVKPILRMNRSLSDYLSFKLPYRTKVEMIDEVKELSDNIEHLINSSKLDIKQKRDAI